MSEQAHGVATCAILTIYRVLCGDPEATPAVDGMVPTNGNLHAERFQRFQGTGRMEDKTGRHFDRLVTVEYGGTVRWSGVWNRGQRERTFRVTVRIGYLFGDHESDTDMIMADDEHAFAKQIIKDQNWSNCSTGCINGFVPKSSLVTRVEPDRKINEITVEVTVTE